MRRAVVQRVEVVVHRLHLRPFEHGEPESEEDVFQLAPGRGEQVKAADRLRGRARKRRVDAILRQTPLELAAAQLGLTALEQVLERPARFVGRAPHARALVRRQLGDAAQQLGQLRPPAEVAHAQLGQLLAGARLRDLRFGVAAQLLHALGHLERTLDDAGAAAGPRASSYRATVAAMAAFSDCTATGIVAARSQRSTTARGRPSRSAPTSRVRAAGGSASSLPRRAASAGACAPVSSATRSPGSSSMSTARAIDTAKIEPMLARTALGEWGSAQPGPNATHEAPKACAERSTVPTLPGSPTPCKYTQ